MQNVELSKGTLVVKLNCLPTTPILRVCRIASKWTTDNYISVLSGADNIHFFIMAVAWSWSWYSLAHTTYLLTTQPVYVH